MEREEEVWRGRRRYGEGGGMEREEEVWRGRRYGREEEVGRGRRGYGREREREKRGGDTKILLWLAGRDDHLKAQWRCHIN